MYWALKKYMILWYVYTIMLALLLCRWCNTRRYTVGLVGRCSSVILKFIFVAKLPSCQQVAQSITVSRSVTYTNLKRSLRGCNASRHGNVTMMWCEDGGCFRTTWLVSSATTSCLVVSCWGPATCCPSPRHSSCSRCWRLTSSSARSSTMTVSHTVSYTILLYLFIYLFVNRTWVQCR